MAATKISDLTAASSVATSDLLPMVQGGSTKKSTFALLPVSTPQQTALDLKAPLASPSLSGNPTAPTQTAGNNSTRLATTAFVTTAVAAGGGGSFAPHYINVKSAPYNAVGDGVADDTVALQAAFDAAHGAGDVGGTAYIPQGTYLISNTLTLRSIRVIGATSGPGYPSTGLDELYRGVRIVANASFPSAGWMVQTENYGTGDPYIHWGGLENITFYGKSAAVTKNSKGLRFGAAGDTSELRNIIFHNMAVGMECSGPQVALAVWTVTFYKCTVGIDVVGSDIMHNLYNMMFDSTDTPIVCRDETNGYMNIVGLHYEKATDGAEEVAIIKCSTSGIHINIDGSQIHRGASTIYETYVDITGISTNSASYPKVNWRGVLGGCSLMVRNNTTTNTAAMGNSGRYNITEVVQATA